MHGEDHQLNFRNNLQCDHICQRKVLEGHLSTADQQTQGASGVFKTLANAFTVFSYSSTVKETDYQAAKREGWCEAVGRIGLGVLTCKTLRLDKGIRPLLIIGCAPPPGGVPSWRGASHRGDKQPPSRFRDSHHLTQQDREQGTRVCRRSKGGQSSVLQTPPPFLSKTSFHRQQGERLLHAPFKTEEPRSGYLLHRRPQTLTQRGGFAALQEHPCAPSAGWWWGSPDP